VSLPTVEVIENDTFSCCRSLAALDLLDKLQWKWLSLPVRTRIEVIDIDGLFRTRVTLFIQLFRPCELMPLEVIKFMSGDMGEKSSSIIF